MLTVSIEKLLTWAYREELPKQPYGSSSSWSIERVDDERRGDHMPMLLSDSDPHPDAMTADVWVRRLEDVVVDWPATQRMLLDDLDGIVNAYNPLSTDPRRKFQVSALVQTHARMGTRPLWDVGIWIEPVLTKNHRPLIHYHGQKSGSQRGKWYSTGACCMLQYVPLLSEIAHARMEWTVWRSALQTLSEVLNSGRRLTAHAVTTPVIPLAPWITGERKPVILQALSRT